MTDSDPPVTAPSMFRALFETAPDAMVVVDGGGRIVLLNPQAEKLFGFPLTELIGRPIEMLMPAGVHGAHRSHFKAYVDKPRTRPMGAGQELTGRRRDAHEFPVEIALSPIDADGRRYFVASIRDISETQRARQALARARYDTFVAQVGQLALESGSDDVTVESIPELVAAALGVEAAAIAFAQGPRAELSVRASTGLDADLLDASPWTLSEQDPVTCQLAGGRPATVEDLAQALHWPPAIVLADSGYKSALVVPLLDRGQPMGALAAIAREFRRFDHDAVHFLQTVANLLSSVVQRSRAQDQLAHSQRLDAVGQLTGGVAHDFNNLLTVISGNLQLLEAELADRPETLAVIASALRAVGRGAELTRKLLTVARRQRLSPRAIDPQALLHELGTMLRRTLGEIISVEIACPEQVSSVYADPAQLDAALVNLALNSRDAMPRGGRLRIAVREQRVEPDVARAELKAGDYVVFAVSDTGIGMPPEVLARAFEPFYTTKDVGKGSGLGLSMVYGFVKQSGGHLVVESRLGYGTRIELYLPATRRSVATPETTAAGHAHRGRETVLVVEDEPDVRGIAVAFLHSLGYAVHAAADAREALAMLAAHAEIALLFSDVVLGSGMSGGELAREARRLRPDLPVLLTSGYERAALDGDDRSTLDLELLRKPYRREELALALRRILDQDE